MFPGYAVSHFLDVFCFLYEHKLLIKNRQTQQFVKPNYGMSLCKFRWTACFGHSYDIIRSVRAKEIAMQQRFPERNGIPLCFTLFSMMAIEL
jgi:hypothetical protein